MQLANASSLCSMADPGISEPGRTVLFLGSGDCFDAPSHIPYVLKIVVKVENKIHIVHNAC